MSDITEHEDQYFRALQRIDLLEGEIEAQRQAIRMLREKLIDAANNLSDAADILEDKGIAEIFLCRSAKFRSIATDGV